LNHIGAKGIILEEISFFWVVLDSFLANSYDFRDFNLSNLDLYSTFRDFLEWVGGIIFLTEMLG
jgi:hypothetical protein